MIRKYGSLNKKVIGVAAAVLVAGLLPQVEASAAGRHREYAPVSAFLNEAEGANLQTPLDFENQAKLFPVTGSQSLYSRCRKSPLNSTSSYGAFGSEVNTILGDTQFQYADGSSCYNPQNEQNIAVNPRNSNEVVTSANDYRDDFVHCWVYESTNGGTSFQNVMLPGWEKIWGNLGVLSRYPCGGDPVLAYGPDGTLYFAALTYGKGKSGLAVAKKPNGGSWQDPVMVTISNNTQIFHDKEWIGVGRNNDVYLTWTLFRDQPGGGYLDSHIYMSKSTNQGSSWSTPTRVSDSAHPYNQGSQVGVTRNGTVIVAYEAAAPNADPALNYMRSALVVARSTNGGNSFSNTEVARIYDDYSCYPFQLPGAQGRQTLSYEQFRINSFPSMAVDPSNGNIAIVWADNEGVGNCGSLDLSFTGITSNQVKLMTSTTNGSTWSAVRRITTGAEDKVYPSVAANGGKISVGYYTRAYSPNATLNSRACGIEELDSATGLKAVPTDPARASAPVCLDFAMRSSTNNFATEVRLTSASSNPYVQFAGSFIGDYTGAAMDSRGRTYFVFTDFRGNPGLTTPNQDTVVRKVS